MKYISAILLLFIAINSYAQKLPVDNFHRIRINKDDKTILADLIPANQPPVKPGLDYYWYDANAVHTTQGGYSGKLLNGTYTEYYLNKNLKEQGNFTTGLKDGTWKKWAEDGKLVSIYTWHTGVKNGNFLLYDNSGKITQSGSYNNDKLDGKLKVYTSPDSITTHYYKNGNEVIKVKKTNTFFRRINPFKNIHLFKKKSKQTTNNKPASN